MKCENWNCWKDCIDLALKAIFVAVFTWGVCSMVCCMSSCYTEKSCGTKTSCCSTKTSCCSKTTTEVIKPCGSHSH